MGLSHLYHGGFPSGASGKNLPENAGDIKDHNSGSIPGLGRSLEVELGNPLHSLACRIPWTEEPGNP